MREFGWAAEAERPQVVALWQRAFGDSEAWVSRFWDLCFAPERILVLRQQGKLAAMASIFETDWLCGGRQTRLWYLYAVATQPEQSGQGLATALLEQAAVLAMQRGVEGLLLVPGETSLQAFYSARGYRPWGARQERQLFKPDSPNPADTAVRIDAEAYGAARERHLQALSHVKLGEDYLRVQQMMAASAGGALLQLQIADTQGCAVVIPTGQTVYVPELLVPQPLWARAVAQIAALFPAQSYRICTPGTDQSFGMLRTWKRELNQVGYLGLALD